MSISTATKLGGAATAAAGVPASVYIANNYLSLYEIEKEVIDSTDNLSSSDPTGESTVEGTTNILKISYSDNKWSCVMRAKLTTNSSEHATLTPDLNKLKKHINARLPVSPASGETPSKSVDETKKKNNKKKLVRDCSWNRISVTDSAIKAELIFYVKKTENVLVVTLFGESETVTET